MIFFGLIPNKMYFKLLKENDYDVDGISSNDGDLTSLDVCKDLIQGYDTIVHCAANTSGAHVMQNSPLSHVTPNIIMNANLMESCYLNGVKKFIFMSSSVVYPYTGNIPNNEEEFTYGDIYEKYHAVGWMKRYTEKLCEMYSKHLDPKMECVVVRPSNIYGPGDKFDERSHVLPATIMKVVDRENPIVVWGNGEDVRDFIYLKHREIQTRKRLKETKLFNYCFSDNVMKGPTHGKRIENWLNLISTENFPPNQKSLEKTLKQTPGSF